MRFTQPLTRGVLLRRYKRFLADVALDAGGEATVHCPNPGAMLGLSQPGLGVWMSRSADPRRKLAMTLEMVEADGALVGVNTQRPNRLVAEALAAGAIPALAGYAQVRPEAPCGDSRFDFLLSDPTRPPCWLEVKNCHLMRAPGLAEFPDCKAARSTRHLATLAARAAAGERAAVLFVIQREDCAAFSACRDLDPAFAAGLEAAADAGVEVMAWRCAMGVEAVTLDVPLPWRR